MFVLIKFVFRREIWYIVFIGLLSPNSLLKTLSTSKMQGSESQKLESSIGFWSLCFDITTVL